MLGEVKMTQYYTDEVNAQIVLALLKENGIKKLVVSPGTTNIPILESVQFDPFFEVYSSVDERSAAYIACGLAAESGEAVALSCTGATASRNYISGLTEAYYRKLPIIAITSTNGNENIGNLVAQTIDRTALQNDIVKISVQLPVVKDSKDFWYCNHLVNKAFLELKKDGGGPVHLNLPTSYLGSFGTKTLPKVNVVKSISYYDEYPEISYTTKIAIFIGSHKAFSKEETEVIENFCKTYNAVVLCDHTSSYNGYGRVLSSLACVNASSDHVMNEKLSPDLIIHIGEVSGDYGTMGYLEATNAKVWRVSNDGLIKDKFKKLAYVFYCEEILFFKKMTEQRQKSEKNTYLKQWENYLLTLREEIPELPFSNLWMANQVSNSLPEQSIIHFGILNSLRSNNFFEYDQSINTNSNVGGFGIDGCLSSLVGASLASPEKVHFGIVGDLAFFYDMNSLGNRHIGKNLRILVINNGGGVEFKNYSHIGATLGEKADEFVAAANHYAGIDSRGETPIKAWVKALGYVYISAENKEEFSENLQKFVDITNDQAMVFECFTDFKEESDALKSIHLLDNKFTLKGKVKDTVKTKLSKETLNKLKKVIRK